MKKYAGVPPQPYSACLRPAWSLLAAVVVVAALAPSGAADMFKVKATVSFVGPARDPSIKGLTAIAHGEGMQIVFQLRPEEKLGTTPQRTPSVRVGTVVWADLTTKRVSLDQRTACCPILEVTPDAPSGSGGKATKAGFDVKENERAKPAPSGSQAGAGAKGQSQAASAQAPPDDDAQDDSEPAEKPKPRATLRLPTMRGGAKGTKLQDYPDAQKLLDEIAKGIAAKEIDVALLGGEKYMINKCLGIKASAGTFRVKLASPNARIEGSGARLTFRIDRVSLNALKIRMRPNPGNPLKVCHFSKKFGVGGSASDVRYELRFDPILDLQQCKLGSVGNVKHRFDIGGLNLKPLQNDLDKVAKNMIEDALNNAANFNMGDRLVASANALLGVQCHK